MNLKKCYRWVCVGVCVDMGYLRFILGYCTSRTHAGCVCMTLVGGKDGLDSHRYGMDGKAERRRCICTSEPAISTMYYACRYVDLIVEVGVSHGPSVREI